MTCLYGVFGNHRATLSHGQACPDPKVTEVLPLVYLHGGGIHVNIRLERHKLCTLVMIGSAPTGARSSSPMLTGTASPLSRGLTCCATAPATRLGLRAARHRPVDREPDRILGRRNPLTTVSPEVAFIFLASAMVIAAPLILITLRKSARPTAEAA
jgi:hypothetical protein